MLGASKTNYLLKYIVHGKYLVWGKIGTNITDTPKMHWHNYALTVAYSTNFSSPIAFTCMVCQNFPNQIFLIPMILVM